MTIQLYLVRHGETPMNQNNQLQGITDMPLTPKDANKPKQLRPCLQVSPLAPLIARIVCEQWILLKSFWRSIPALCSIAGPVCANITLAVWKG